MVATSRHFATHSSYPSLFHPLELDLQSFKDTVDPDERMRHRISHYCNRHSSAYLLDNNGAEMCLRLIATRRDK
jgi:hypothetical protein